MKSVASQVAPAGKAINLLGAALGVLLFAVSLFSQGNFGRILGTVTDQTGGVISGAAVSIIDRDRGIARTLTTDDAGEYNAPTLLPGTYSVRVEAKGFKTTERQNVVVEVGKEVRVDLTGQPGAQEQTITVTESMPLVETTNATLGGTLNNAQIQDLPLNGRNYQSLVSLRPGVMLQPGGGPWTQSTNGIRPDESVWMVDGVYNGSFYDARPITGSSSFITDGATILPIDAIQEFNLEENPKAEFGWKPGAVVNVGIRSGTNTLHGAAYAFGRADAFDARNIFNPAPDANGNCLPNPALPAVCDKLPTRLEQFGGVVGGPIKKDKLFFFAGYEGLRDLIGNAFSANLPALGSLGGDATHSMVDAVNGVHAAGLTPSSVSLATLCPNAAGQSLPLPSSFVCTGGLIQGASATSTHYLSSFPNTNTSDSGVAKMDYRINSKHMINGALWIGNYSGNGEDRPIFNSTWLNAAQIRNWTVVGNWVWTPSSTVVNEARLGYTRSSARTLQDDGKVFADGTGLTGGAGYALNTGITSTGGFPTLVIQGLGGRLGSAINRPLENGPNPFYDFTDSVSYLRGKHSFKFGGEYAHIETDVFNHDTRGRIDFMHKQVAFSGSTALEDFFAGKPFKGTQIIGDAHRTLEWANYAGFIQDDWRVTPKLIVNLGLRYSYISPMKEVNGLLGNFDPTRGLVQQGQASVGDTLWKPDHKDFSPRLGFAWDVTGKGTTVVRAGASIIYSSFIAGDFLFQGGLSDFNSGSLGAVPTGGCTKPVVGAGATCQTAGGTLLSSGGTITLGAVNYTGSLLNWNGVVFPGGGISCTAALPCNITAVDPNLHTPYVTNWNLSITHAFNNNLSLEVGYVGNHGTKLAGVTDINQINLTTGTHPFDTKNDAAGNPMTYLNYINWFSNYGYSNYHSLQATLTERITHGLSFTAGYTYGHGLDNGSESRYGPLPQISTNPRADYASGDFDVRHRVTLTASYELPGKRGFGQLLEGWKLNSIVTLQSAQPWNIADTSNNFSGGGDNNDRWNFSGNPGDFKARANSIPYCSGPNACTSISGISGASTATPDGWSKCVTADNAFVTAAIAAGDALASSNLVGAGCFVAGNSVLTPNVTGAFGTMGRNIFRDNGFKDWDLSVFKTFKFKERLSAEFRFEVFNVLNHATISNPNGANNGSNNGDDPSNPSAFGDGLQTPDFATGNPIIGSGDNRDIQIGLKLTF